jgi:predicted GIY-YIG superfamily endonuclease
MSNHHQPEYIYYLVCPIDGKVKYVGKTKNPKARYTMHIKKLDKTNTPKRQWLEQLFSKNLQPKLQIVQSFSDPELARQMEQWHVDLHSETTLNIHNPEKGKESRKWEEHDWTVNKPKKTQ